MTTTTTALKTTDKTFDIEQASKMTGLSAGVLRMWELRYGWPRPGRLANGYRYFSQYQIDDLKRMAALVKSGMQISRLIDHGMPKWPGMATPATAIVTLEAAHAAPKPATPIAQEIRARLLDAMKAQNDGKAWEQLTRCAWEIHPSDQLLGGWLPCMLALSEFRDKGKTFPNREVLVKQIRDSIKSSLGRAPAVERPLWIVPTSADDEIAAFVTALGLTQRGIPARPWLWEKLPGGAFVTIGAQPPAPSFASPLSRGHVTIFGSPQQAGVCDLILDPEQFLTDQPDAAAHVRKQATSVLLGLAPVPEPG